MREKIGIVHATLFTHDHADHVFGLDDLRLFPYYLGHSMPVYCEEQVEARIRKSFDYAFAEEAKNYGGGVPQIEFRRITTEPFEMLSQRIMPIRLEHGKFRVLGFRFGNIAYCTDTNDIPPESWPLLEGLDVLVLDALRHKPHPTHFSLDEAVEVARRVGARRTCFTHMSHDLEHEATNAVVARGHGAGLRRPAAAADAEASTAGPVSSRPVHGGCGRRDLPLADDGRLRAAQQPHVVGGDGQHFVEVEVALDDRPVRIVHLVELLLFLLLGSQLGLSRRRTSPC